MIVSHTPARAARASGRGAADPTMMPFRRATRARGNDCGVDHDTKQAPYTRKLHLGILDNQRVVAAMRLGSNDSGRDPKSCIRFDSASQKRG